MTTHRTDGEVTYQKNMIIGIWARDDYKMMLCVRREILLFLVADSQRNEYDGGDKIK